MKSIQWITRTAILVAFAIAFQMLRLVMGDSPYITYLIGTLVNMTLAVAVFTMGWGSAMVVAIITPLIAALQGHAPGPMIPILILCNTLYVSLLRIGCGNLSRVVWSVIAGIAKYAAMVLLIVMFLVGGLSSHALTTIGIAQIVQLITGVLGALLGIVVARALDRTMMKKQS